MTSEEQARAIALSLTTFVERSFQWRRFTLAESQQLQTWKATLTGLLLPEQWLPLHQELLTLIEMVELMPSSARAGRAVRGELRRLFKPVEPGCDGGKEIINAERLL